MGPHAAVAAVRVAIRRSLRDLPPGRTVLVACSGGPDSLALAAGLAFVAPRGGYVGGLVTVDHRLQSESHEQAERVLAAAAQLGLAPRLLECVAVTPAGSGPEAAARAARYAALDRVAIAHDAVVLLGHTLDDQAETVLLRLARGSGARSLAGMPATRGAYRRPLLTLRRTTTEAACAAQGLVPFRDPHNDDPAFTRVRVRRTALPALEQALGPGVAEALARSAHLLGDDADAMDAAAAAATADLGPHPTAAALAALPPGVRRRVLRGLALDAGVPPGSLTARHLQDLDALVIDWHGQGPVALPGGLAAYRRSGRLGVSPRGAIAPASPRPIDGPEGRRVLQPPLHTPLPSAPHTSRAPLYAGDIAEVVVSQERIAARIAELAEQVHADYADRVNGQELVLVGVLKGAVMVMADLARALPLPVSLEFMAVSSYGAAASSSGVVRILKDLDRDIAGRHVLVVEDVVDSGLTLSWLLRNLTSRGPASLEVCALLRKPEARAAAVGVRYVGFDIPGQFVVGYGLDYAERYRDLPYVGVLRPEVYAG